MPKCGCGDVCTCRVQGGLGITVPGTGNEDNPYIANIDGAAVSGPGIGWSANKFTVRITPGGGLEFDAAGNLKTTGGGGGGGVTYPATVAALEASTSEIIGGSLGAGFYAKPEGLLSSFRHGMSVGLDMMSVGVRFLRDGTPVVHLYENLDQNGLPGDQVQNQDLNRWQSTLVSKAGWAMFYDQELFGNPPSNGSTLGWFGYYEPGQYGLTTLEEVLREFGGKVVLNLHLLFPLLNAQGEFVAPTPSWRTDLFLGRVRDMIERFALQNSVIVSAYALSIPSGVQPPRINVLDWFASAGIRVGAQLDTPGDLTTVPAANYPATWTWVFMSASLTKAQIQPYVNKPLHVIIYGVSRRYLRDTLVRLPNGAGAKGVLSADPEYYGAKFGERHRDTVPRFVYQTVKPGYLPPNGGDNIAYVGSTARGSYRLGLNRIYLDRNIPAPLNPDQQTKWVTFGSFIPNPAPTSFAIDFGIGMDGVQPTGGYRWVTFGFGMLTDHAFRDRWQPNGQPAFAPDPVNWPLDSGYAFLIDTNGFVFLQGWQQGSRTEMFPGALPPAVRAINQNVPVYFRIGVNQNGIRLSDSSYNAGTNTYTQGALIADIKTDLAKAYRGLYFFIGRHKTDPAHNNGSGDWWGFIDNPQLVLNGAAPIGPPA